MAYLGNTFSIGNFDAISSGTIGGIQYKGSIATLAELQAKTDMKNGDVWLVLENNKKYIWSEKDNAWQLYSDSGLTEEEVKTIIDNRVNPLLAQKVDKNGTDRLITAEEGEKIANAITEHQSLEGYATEQWVEDKGYLTEHQSLTDYAKKSEIPTKTSQLTNDSGYLTEHQSLADYAKKSEIPVVPTNVSAFTNDAGYLTEHQDISGKADKATTLSGYGITDAKIENGTITLGSNSVTPITSHQDISGKADITYVDEEVAKKNAVSVSATGTATDVVKYITIDGVEKKLAEGSTPTVVSPSVEFTELPETVNVGDVLTLEMTPHKGTNNLDRIELLHGSEEATVFSNLVDGQPKSVTYTIEAEQAGNTLSWEAIVYDTESNTGNDTISVEVAEIAGPNVAIDGPTTGTVGTELTYTAQLTKGTYNFAKLEWVVNDTVMSEVTEGLNEETTYEYKYTPDSAGSKEVKARINDSNGNINADFRNVTISEATGYNWEVGYDSYDMETEEFIEYVSLQTGTSETSSINVTYTFPSSETIYGNPVFKYSKTAPNLTSITNGGFPEDVEYWTEGGEPTIEGNYKVYRYNDGLGSLNGITYGWKV